MVIECGVEEGFFIRLLLYLYTQKQRFNERECLKNRLDEFEKAIVLCKSQNEELRAGICRKDEEIQQLKQQLQRSIENGHHLEAKIEVEN